ncbi:hypothetical protein M0802_016088 [Mischocyttarus mexicanus]|nr:hypothetical protein M0802_016088 [Mischocyttarus mexicanus]
MGGRVGRFELVRKSRREERVEGKKRGKLMEEEEEEEEEVMVVVVVMVVMVVVVNGESCRGAQRSRWIERFHDFASRFLKRR